MIVLVNWPLSSLGRGTIPFFNTALADAFAFVIGDPECFVLAVVQLGDDDRTASDKTKLILVQGGDTTVEIAARVEIVVAVEPEQGPMQFVGAALTDDIDLIGAEAIFSGINGRLFLEFLDGI